MNTTRKVGRPTRNDNRRQILTFFPVILKDEIKKISESNNLSMSDWIDSKISIWLDSNNNNPVYISKTHTKKDSHGNEWSSVQVVLLVDTFEKIQCYCKKFDVSIAGLIYTIVKNNSGN